MTAHPLPTVLLGNLLVMLAGWLVQRRTHNASIVELLWAAGIGASALYYGAVAQGSLVSGLLVGLMGGIWSFRLIMHLLRRMLVEHEDPRYRHLRARWGAHQQRWLFALFVGKAVSATLYSVPLYVAASNPAAQSDEWTVAAALVYLAGFSGEAYADLQLSAFRAKPRHLGRTCRRGLWRYSRHPNYLFGCLYWFCYVLLAVGMPWPQWSATLLGPLLTALGWIVRIPAAEAQAIRTRGDDYRDYRAATSALLPWLPRGWPNDAPEPRRRDAATPSRVPTPTSLRTPPVYLKRSPVPPSSDAGERPAGE
ncbi:MAG TPA: DUF1295 domain-containing protein [Dokdonella sp.]